jgi:hypothetical protein
MNEDRESGMVHEATSKIVLKTTEIVHIRAAVRVVTCTEKKTLVVQTSQDDVQKSFLPFELRNTYKNIF